MLQLPTEGSVVWVSVTQAPEEMKPGRCYVAVLWELRSPHTVGYSCADGNLIEPKSCKKIQACLNYIEWLILQQVVFNKTKKLIWPENHFFFFFFATSVHQQALTALSSFIHTLPMAQQLQLSAGLGLHFWCSFFINCCLASPD